MKSGEILVTVISKKGKCISGHEVGDTILINNKEIKGKICIHALYSMLPKVFAMMHNAEFPWLEDQNVATHACPDAYNPVVFEIRK